MTHKTPSLTQDQLLRLEALRIANELVAQRQYHRADVIPLAEANLAFLKAARLPKEQKTLYHRSIDGKETIINIPTPKPSNSRRKK